jgi:hypothetical protein
MNANEMENIARKFRFFFPFGNSAPINFGRVFVLRAGRNQRAEKSRRASGSPQ